MNPSWRKHRGIAIIGTLWLGSIATGLGLLADYAAQPGLIGQVPQQWPQSTQLSLAPDRHTVVLAVHPRCPCTRASINELERSIGHAKTPPQIYALVFEPTTDEATDLHANFAATDITRNLRRIPNTTVIPDPGSTIAADFGALTSGHAIVYDTKGNLVFSGGLTPTRAHEGPNTGTESLKRLFNGDQPIAQNAPVFGCPLCSETKGIKLETCFDAATCPSTEVQP